MKNNLVKGLGVFCATAVPFSPPTNYRYVGHTCMERRLTSSTNRETDAKQRSTTQLHNKTRLYTRISFEVRKSRSHIRVALAKKAHTAAAYSVCR